MQGLWNKLPTAHQHPYLTDTELEMIFTGSRDSRYGKVKRLLAQNHLLHIRRGLYCIQDYPVKPHPFELAQLIYSPSYISLESALSYHQLIPETVYTITSASAKRSKEFRTPLGVFSYLHLPLKDFYTETELIVAGHYRFLMAKPWKAICDYIYCYKKNWRNIQPLLQSLRINREDLPPLPDTEIEILIEYYHRQSLSRFLKNIAGEL